MNDVMTRGDIANIERIMRKQERVAKAGADQRAAELKAAFEAEISARYNFDDDEIWKEAFAAARAAAETAQADVARRCEAIGIPAEFAPSVECHWYGRGENGVKERRAELRRKADAEIAALKQSARTKIEAWSLQAQTELASRTLTSEAAQTYLENMPAMADLMPTLEFQKVEHLARRKFGWGK